MKTLEKLKAKAKESAKAVATKAKAAAKAAVKKEIAKQKVAMKARKVAWKRAADGHYYRFLGDGRYAHVIGSKVYITNRDLTEVEEVTGSDVTYFIKSAKATAAVREAKEASKEIAREAARKTAAREFGSASKKDVPAIAPTKKKVAPKKVAPTKKKVAPKKVAPTKKKVAPKKVAPTKRAATPSVQKWLGL